MYFDFRTFLDVITNFNNPMVFHGFLLGVFFLASVLFVFWLGHKCSFDHDVAELRKRIERRYGVTERIKESTLTEVGRRDGEGASTVRFDGLPKE